MADANFANVISLTLLNGANASTTLVDNGPVARTWTAFNAAALTTTLPKFGSACVNFPASSTDYVQSAGDQRLTGDFTIDCWMKTGASYSSKYGPLCCSHETTLETASFGWTIWDNNNLRFYYGTTPTLILGVSPGGAMEDNTWHHYAMTRSGSTLRMYFDGVHQTATNGSNTWNTSTVGQSTSNFDWGFWPWVGTVVGDPSARIGGQMDCLRVTTMARWTGTGSFTPPTDESDYYGPGGPFPFYIRSALRGGLYLPRGF